MSSSYDSLTQRTSSSTHLMSLQRGRKCRKRRLPRRLRMSLSSTRRHSQDYLHSTVALARRAGLTSSSQSGIRSHYYRRQSDCRLSSIRSKRSLTDCSASLIQINSSRFKSLNLQRLELVFPKRTRRTFTRTRMLLVTYMRSRRTSTSWISSTI